MLLIGLTGGIGSGKSTVARLLQSSGAALIDADSLSHTLTAPGGAAISLIRQQFGSEFISTDGALNRQVMRDLVFTQPHFRQRLQDILHPLIAHEVDALRMKSKQLGIQILVHDIPLLVESADHWRPQFDAIWVVDCTSELQIQRVMARSGWTLNQVQAVIATQATREQRLQIADGVLNNCYDEEILRREAHTAWQYMLFQAEEMIREKASAM